MTCATSVPSLVFPGISVLDLGPDARHIRQTSSDRDVTQTSDANYRLMPLLGGGGITSCRRAAATICPRPGLQVVTRYTSVRIWIGHHYCMSMLACQYNQPKRPGDLDLIFFTLKVVSESRVTCATSVPSLVFPGISVLDLGPMHVTDVRRRQTETSHRRQTRIIA